MHLIVKNVGTDLRPDFRAFDCEGREAKNVLRIEVDASPIGTTANIVIDLDRPALGWVPDDSPEWRGPTNRIGRALVPMGQN